MFVSVMIVESFHNNYLMQIGLFFFISWFKNLPTQCLCFCKKNLSAGHILKNNCICHLCDVFSKLKYYYKPNFKYMDVVGGHRQAYCVFVHFFSPSSVAFLQCLLQ